MIDCVNLIPFHNSLHALFVGNINVLEGAGLKQFPTRLPFMSSCNNITTTILPPQLHYQFRSNLTGGSSYKDSLHAYSDL